MAGTKSQKSEPPIHSFRSAGKPRIFEATENVRGAAAGEEDFKMRTPQLLKMPIKEGLEQSKRSEKTFKKSN